MALKKWLRRSSITGIYKITSHSGMIYKGQSWDIKNRWRLHKSINNKGASPIVKNSLLKHGIENHRFEIVYRLPSDVSQSILDNYEIFYIDQYRSCGFKMMNIKDGGGNAKSSKETKAKQAIAMKGNTWGFKKGSKSWNHGKVGVQQAWNKGLTGYTTLSEEVKRNISTLHKGNKYNLGRSMPVKTRDALTKVNVGRKMPEHLNKLLSEKFRTPENAKRMGYMNRGKVRSDENKKKISETLKSKTDNKGEFHKMVKLTNEKVLEIRSRYSSGGISTRLLGIEYDISKTNIKDIVNRKIWKHI